MTAPGLFEEVEGSGQTFGDRISWTLTFLLVLLTDTVVVLCFFSGC